MATPIERPFTATQARNQWASSLEPNTTDGENPLTEDVTLPATLEEEEQEPTPTPTPVSPPAPPGFDLQTLLLALSRQAAPPPQKKRYRGVKEPDPFSGGSPDELRAFIFQCQIYF